MNDFITKVLDAVINPVINVLANVIRLLVSTRWSAILVWIILVNIIGFILMKRDKQYAKEGKRRISELTLLSTAAVGGSIGVYFGMYKFNHKTLHKQFTILVPIIMLIQMTFISYELFINILK